MIQILNGRSESCIERIVSHRISTDKSKYEYHVKMNNIDSAIWVSESYINELNANLLECYKKKAFFPQISYNGDENCYLVDSSKYIALNFNECMEIKLEIGIVCDESIMDTSESNEQVVNSSLKIKAEKVECEESENTDTHNTQIIDKSLKGNELNSQGLQEEPAILSETSNGNISKTLSEDSLNIIDCLFDQLPIVSKVTNDSRNINRFPLAPLNLEKLKDIIETSDLDRLQDIMYSDQKESLQTLINNYPCLFILAAKNDDLPTVSSLLSLGVDINSMDTNSKTALMYACENENESLIDLLVNNGAAINNINNTNDSILHFCCQKNKPKAVQTLLNLGADFARIRSNKQLSLNEYAKNMNLTDIIRISDKHLSQLSTHIKNVIVLQLGSKVRLDARVMPIYVLSPFELQNEIQINFDANSKLLRRNSLLFILTGLIIGPEMKCFFSDCHQIKSVVLNDVEQQSYTPVYKTITSFNPLTKINKLVIRFDNIKCRKKRDFIRQILVKLSATNKQHGIIGVNKSVTNHWHNHYYLGFTLLASNAVKSEAGIYEFYVSVNNSHSMLWISESYLHKYHFDILETYKKCHNINGELGNQVLPKEADVINHSKFIAINFNEEFGIKLEVGIRETPLENNILECVPSPGASTYLMNPIQDIKTESLEVSNPFDSNQNCYSDIHSSSLKLEEYIPDIITSNKSSSEISNEPFEEIDYYDDNNQELCNVQSEVDFEFNTSMENTFDKYLSNETASGSNKENTIYEETIPHEESEINEAVVSINNIFSIGKVRKVRKDIASNNNDKCVEKIKTAKNLFASEVEASYLDTVDELFMHLPITTKVLLDVDKSSDIELSPITLDILISIINKGNIDLLQSYMNSRHRQLLQQLVRSKPCLIVLAAQCNHIHIVGLLLTMGADINGIDDQSCNALMRACENENQLLIDFLVNNGAAMNYINNDSNIVILYCCLKNKVQSFNTLLNLGVNFNKILLEPPCSLDKYLKQMELKEMSQILDKHIINLSTNIKESILPLLGPKIKILNQIMPINVVSLFEIQNESISMTFDGDIPPVKPNHCNILFLVTGIVVGRAMKLLLSDSNKISSVFLNGVEQQSLIHGNYKVLTSFSPLKGDNNSLVLNYEKISCRKLLSVSANSVTFSTLPAENSSFIQQRFPKKKEIFKIPDNFYDEFVDFTRKYFSVDKQNDVMQIELNDPLQKFRYLSQCQMKFNKAITNSYLSDLRTIRDVKEYFETEVISRDVLHNLNALKDKLPKNLNIQEDPIIFDHSTDSKYGGITAFPHRDRIEVDLKAQEKYPSIKALRTRKIKIDYDDLY